MPSTEPRSFAPTGLPAAGVAERIAQGSRALADPTRVRLVSLILHSVEGKAFVSELAGRLGLTQPTVTHHLRKLKDDGMLRREFIGRQAWYSVPPDRLADVVELLETVATVDGAARGRAGKQALAHESVLSRIADDLAMRFTGTFSRETVVRYVSESHSMLADQARIARYLPSLTGRFAADRLAALERAEAARPTGVPEVLFVCVKNAGRSQMAAAMLRALAGDSVRVRSAGSEPVAQVHPFVSVALDEIGVSLAGEFPKPLTDEVVRAADVVVTMGCGDACPIYPGRRYLDWELDDPFGLPLDGVRAVRDDIDLRVRQLLTELDVHKA